jgi:uncharacterized protein (DUF2267 family)
MLLEPPYVDATTTNGGAAAIRDRIPVNEAAQLAAQLPELLRGAFYEGWVPAHTPQKYREGRQLLRRVSHDAGLTGETEASFAVAAVMNVLRRRISEGEVDDVIHVMPDSVRSVIEQSPR